MIKLMLKIQPFRSNCRKSQPEEIHYNISQYTDFENATSEHDLGPQVAHVYDIQNLGPSVADEVEIYVMWPFETQSGEPLMYMLSPPELNGNIYCDPSAYINYKRIEMDRLLVTKSILKQIGVQERVSTHHRSSSQGQHSEVTVEHGQRAGSARGSSYYGNRRLTEEEKKKLDAEENVESTGDASMVHRDRHSQQAATAGWSSGRTGHGGAHFQHSWSSSQGGGGSRYSSYNGSYGGGESRRIASAYQVSTTSAPFTRPPTPTPTIYRAGMYRLDDIPTEEHVNQDISRLNARTETSTASTGRRRMMSQQDGEPPRPDLITGASPLEKAVQGAGHGQFHTATVDLGQLSRSNVDDEIHRRGQAAHIANSYNSGGHGQSYNYQQQTGGGSRTASSQSSSQASSGFNQGRQSSSTWHVGSPDPLSEEEDYTFEDYDDEDNGHPAGYKPTHHGRVPDRFQHYRRFQRSSENDDDLAELEKELHCNVTKCAVLKCIAYNLVKDDNVYIAIRTRLVAKTLDKVSERNIREIEDSGKIILSFIMQIKNLVIR